MEKTAKFWGQPQQCRCSHTAQGVHEKKIISQGHRTLSLSLSSTALSTQHSRYKPAHATNAHAPACYHNHPPSLTPQLCPGNAEASTRGHCSQRLTNMKNTLLAEPARHCNRRTHSSYIQVTHKTANKPATADDTRRHQYCKLTQLYRRQSDRT